MQPLGGAAGSAFHFPQISPDVGFGTVGPEGCLSEATPYDHLSPYSSSMTATDNLTCSWHHTFELLVVLTNWIKN